MMANITMNNLRNLEQNLITAENQILQNENRMRRSDTTIAVTNEEMQFRSGNRNPEEDVFKNEVESQRSRMIVEQALQGVPLCETKGFYLKYSGLTSCPSISITPSIMGSGSELFSGSPSSWWVIKGSSNLGCFCCFMPAYWNWQTITLRQEEREVLNFIYRPQFSNCFGTKEQIVDIYIPQRIERIGYIKYTRTVEDGAIIADCISKSVFLVNKLVDHPTLGIKITDSAGTTVSVTQGSRAVHLRGFTTWTDFETQYSPLATNMPASAKAVMAVGLMMWGLTYREKSARNRTAFFLACLLFGMILGVIIKSSY
ncbi:unnamed protein product [Orchesella dallaii]|uniref:Phospholipid scramblase n=1 Tax=Orchesella dallaii TaxID=48710 RepID=A0ABP1QD08_9HEXA